MIKKIYGIFSIILIFLVGYSQADTITVGTSGCNFTSIQDAVNASNDGDRIEVQSGIYYENVKVDKQLDLKGIDSGMGSPVVDAAGIGSAIELQANGVLLSGFVTRKSQSDVLEAGISVISDNNTITNNTVCYNEEYGILLRDSSNNTISNNKINNSLNGIFLYRSCDNNTISENNVTGCRMDIGLVESSSNAVTKNRGSITLTYCSNNNISGNSANNSQVGIHAYVSNNNVITDNFFNNNCYGIRLEESRGNILRNNIMIKNSFNFKITSYYGTLLTYTHINDIDSSNLVDGKPICYLVNISDMVIDSSSNAGTVYCINCQNLTIKDLSLANNGEGIYLFNTSNSRITNNNLSNNYHGILLEKSNKNMITENSLSKNGFAISLSNANENIISNNNASCNLHQVPCTSNYDPYGYGIYLKFSNYNHLIGNNLSENKFGVYLYNSDNNVLDSNLLSRNSDCGIKLDGGSCSNIIEKNSLSENEIGIILSNKILQNEIGIQLDYNSNNNLIRWNNLNNNHVTSIRSSSSQNSIYMNNFIANAGNVEDEGHNIWNSTEKIKYRHNERVMEGNPGNYWSNYSIKTVCGIRLWQSDRGRIKAP
jgi:parallel beta-helix repeat protein